MLILTAVCPLARPANAAASAGSPTASDKSSAVRTEDTASAESNEMRATELAQSFFEPLIAKASTSSERASLLHQRGVLYLCSSCKARALKDLNDAIHLLPKNSDERSDLLYHRARALLLPPSPEPVAAIADLSQCIAAHPDDADPLLVRASAYKLIGRKDLAQADIDRADKLSTKPAAATVAEPRPSGKP